MNKHVWATAPGKAILPPTDGTRTWYHGNWRTQRSGWLVHIKFRYQYGDNNDIINEEEVNVTKIRKL